MADIKTSANQTQDKNMSDNQSLFTKIIKRQIPADIVYQDDKVTAFKDINPKAPIHILIIPNKLIPTVNDISNEDIPTIGHMVYTAAKIAKEHQIAERGYRLIINCNKEGGQEVYHLHMHLVGGKKLGKMLP